MGLITAEIRKLTTVRTPWALTLIGLLFVAFSVAFFVFEEEVTGRFTGADAQVGALIGQIVSYSVIVLVVGALAMTTEFRHGTIGRTLQLDPSRTRVMLAKLVVGVLYAVVFFLGGLVVVAIAVLARSGLDLELGSATVRAVWQGAGALAGAGILGVAFGALVRSQVIAITVALVWSQIVEPLVNFLYAPVGRWLPFQLLNSLFITDEMAGTMPNGMADAVDAAIALPVFLSYVAVTAVAAGLLMRYRDV